MKKHTAESSTTGFIWFWGSVIVGAVAVYSFKAPVVWVFTVVIGLAASFAWDKFCEIAEDIKVMRKLVEAVVHSFAMVRMDDRHDFNFVMDRLAEELYTYPEVKTDRSRQGP
jgi:hypothetical protein